MRVARARGCAVAGEGAADYRCEQEGHAEGAENAVEEPWEAVVDVLRVAEERKRGRRYHKRCPAST
jgi:hypothetical protein